MNKMIFLFVAIVSAQTFAGQVSTMKCSAVSGEQGSPFKVRMDSKKAEISFNQTTIIVGLRSTCEQNEKAQCYEFMGLSPNPNTVLQLKIESNPTSQLLKATLNGMNYRCQVLFPDSKH